MRPSPELEQEIMEYIFSKKCPDHKEALEIWNNNPWVAVSMYEVHQYPENLGLPIAFPQGLDIPEWYQKKMADEELLAMQGEPLYIAYPRYTNGEIEGAIINKFGRVIIDEDD